MAKSQTTPSSGSARPAARPRRWPEEYAQRKQGDAAKATAAAETVTARYLDEYQAASYLNIPVSTMRVWRSRGVGPAFGVLGRGEKQRRLIRYDRQELDRFVARDTVTPLPDARDRRRSVAPSAGTEVLA